MAVPVIDADSPARPTATGGLLLVATSALLSLLAWQPLGETVRIRWSVGTYYGPEYAPAALVLAVFPIAAAVAYGGFALLARALDGTEEFEETRWAYELSVLATLGLMLLVQLLLVAANVL